MLTFDTDWNLSQWHNWLESEMDLCVGRDYKWAWADNTWAIEFHDPQMELMVKLKAPAR